MAEEHRQHERIVADFGREQLRGTIDFARDAQKSIILINGGAAIALLAFTGNIWSSDTNVTTLEINSLKYAVFLFTLGVVLSSFGYIFSFWTQNRYYRESANSVSIHMNLNIILSENHSQEYKDSLKIEIGDLSEKNRKIRKYAKITQIIAFGFSILSLASLVAGVIFSSQAFFNLSLRENWRLLF